MPGRSVWEQVLPADCGKLQRDSTGHAFFILRPVANTILFFFRLIRETVERRRRTGERRRDLIELMSEALTDSLMEEAEREGDGEEDLNHNTLNTVNEKDGRQVGANGNNANEK